jgi:hypothetical protein
VCKSDAYQSFLVGTIRRWGETIMQEATLLTTYSVHVKLVFFAVVVGCKVKGTFNKRSRFWI